MSHKYSAISIFCVVVLGVAATVTYFGYAPRNTPAMHTTLQMDAYMENVSAIIMNKQGKPNMKIVSPKMTHYATNDTTQLIDPELTLYRKSPKPWFIKAKYAKATDGIENIHFSEDVTIHHAADDVNPATLIKTSTLLVQPNKQIASTNDEITLIQPDLVVKATGMYADLNTGDIKLISQARGEYTPGVSNSDLK